MMTVKQMEAAMTDLFEQVNPYPPCTRKWYLWYAAMWRQRAARHAVRWPDDPDMAQECADCARECYLGARYVKKFEILDKIYN